VTLRDRDVCEHVLSRAGGNDDRGDLALLAEHLDALPFSLSGATAAQLITERDRVARMLRGIVSRTAEPRAPLLVVFGGGSGAGKSTTVNSIAGQRVAAASVLRPTTRVPTLACHHDDRAWFADDRVLPDFIRVVDPDSDDQSGGRLLRIVTCPGLPPGVAILDSPDIDSVELDNHLLAAESLDAADAWVWLATARTYADEVLRFMTDHGVPFTNNLAEQAVRMPTVKQTVSGCFRTLRGAQSFCIVRSYLDTLRKQGANLFHALTQTFQGNVPQPRFA
jgi:hypothetical protein